MNTVLDDNKKLCLMSGEIIAMSPRMNLIFECMDLAVASPATVSRCGMVYMEPTELGWQPLMRSWLMTLPPRVGEVERAWLVEHFEWLLDPCLWYVRRECKCPVPTQEIQLARALMRMLAAHMDLWLEDAEGNSKAPDPARGKDMLQGLFVFCLIWAVGATVDEASRAKFDLFLRALLRKEVPEILSTPGAPQPVCAATLKLGKPPPDKGLVYDCCFQADRGAWVEWLATVPKYEVPAGSKFTDINVQTADTVQYGYVFDNLVQHGVPVLIAGNTGTGKTLLARNRLLMLDTEVYQSIFLNYSAQTSAQVSQGIVDGQLDKRRKGVFGPPFGKKCVVFVDDLNMPALEEYGAQPPIELLRQWMDHNGWYDLKECTFRELVDLQFVSAMGPPGGGRNPVTPRYLRHYNMVWCIDYASDSLLNIFSTILKYHLNLFPGEVKTTCNAMVEATINIYQNISAELLPTPAKSHYTFNLRDISKVFQGVMQSTVKSVETANQLLCLWAHECLRVFADRLVDATDVGWFYAQLEGQLKDKFKKSWVEITETEDKRLLFGDFMKSDTTEYLCIPDMDQLIEKAQVMLEDYNAMSKKPMELVIFPFAVEHVCRVLRVIKQPLGNALLAGVGGSGRQSLTALATHMADFTMFQIELSKNYDGAAWKDDLKRLLRLAGETGDSTVFCFSDTQVKTESMVEDISNILNAGEVPNLFPGDEVASVIEGLGPKAKELGMADATPAAMWRLFTAQCRANLHVVLCMSPIGEAFRTRLRKFPALVNCCTIDWFTAWPRDALVTVAESFLQVRCRCEPFGGGGSGQCAVLQVLRRWWCCALRTAHCALRSGSAVVVQW